MIARVWRAAFALCVAAFAAAPSGAAHAAAPPQAPVQTATPPPTPRPEPRAGRIIDPAPRPVAEVRIQNRYATKLRRFQIFGGLEYLARGDFYVSPGARVGASYYLFEPLGLELHATRFFSHLNDEGERVQNTVGYVPDSHAPTWLLMAGARYSVGYGKLLLGGLGTILHFEPQVFLHAGVHDHSGDVGPSVDAGVGFLVFVTPRLFARIEVALMYERESRSGQGVSVLGLLPSLVFGGVR